MASLKERGGKRSLTQGSDELEEMFCEHCEKDLDRYIPADGFCVNCLEYMCATCLRYHKKYTKDHSIQDKDSMPQDFCFDKCSVHTDQLIKFYCNDCQKTTCSECKLNDHKTCKNIGHLPTLARGVEHSKELSDLMENIEHLSEEVDGIENHINSNIQTISTQGYQALSTITKHKEDILAAYKSKQEENLNNFDKKMEETIARLKEKRQKLVKEVALQQKKIEQKVKKEEMLIMTRVKRIKNTNHIELETLKNKNSQIKTNMKAWSSYLKKQLKIGNRCKIFVTMKISQKNTENAKQDALKVNESIDVNVDKYTVKPEERKWNWDNFEEDVFSFKELPSTRRIRTASYYSDKKIKQIGWSALCFLSATTLLTTDYSGNSFMVFQETNVNPGGFKRVRVYMSSGPWAVTKVEDNKVAATFPDSGIIKMITFSEAMTVTKTIDIEVGAGCHGIACSNDNLIVSYSSPGSVKILDRSGHELKAFGKDSKGQPLFSNPWFLVLSPDNATIYVSDYAKHTVTSLTFDGKVKAIYKDDQLSIPCQLTVDESGTVYVCGQWSNNVHQLSSDLTKVKILLNRNDGIKHPVSVTHCQKNKRLYVGLYNNKIIKVFNLSVDDYMSL